MYLQRLAFGFDKDIHLEKIPKKSKQMYNDRSCP